ncbi:hypothetical protein, partial [Chryseobacterium sp. OSA05B]|uniref:hypothetical protein n=1 Tax=Chryseobacterium sp. OSA05B TaxID=2862650 RepID=UPI001CBB0B38
MEINKDGNWNSLWTEQLKLSLEENLDNQSVGEYLVFENEKIKIWTIHLHPGKSLPFHKHCK